MQQPLRTPSPGYRPVLVTENTLHASYLVTEWIARFGAESDIVIRDEQPRSDVSHAAPYREVSKTERAMIKQFGMPERPAGAVNVTFIGRELNDPGIKDWLASQCAQPVRPFFFVFLDRLLAPWWIELSDSRIVNAHSAVLPVARGLYAIEQIAATKDRAHFLAAAGATVHYVDSGIDTGPIVVCERLNNPMQFSSIWECKGHLFMMAFDMLISVAESVSRRPSRIPVGVAPVIDKLDPDFKRAEFTLERQQQAEEGYLAMKRSAY